MNYSILFLWPYAWFYGVDHWGFEVDSRLSLTTFPDKSRELHVSIFGFGFILDVKPKEARV